MQQPTQEPPKKKRHILRWAIVGVFVIVVIAAIGSTAGGGDDTKTAGSTVTTAGATAAAGASTTEQIPSTVASTTTVAPTTTAAPTTTEAPTTTTEAGPPTYSNGIYLVGTDLPPGRYKGTADGFSGYWQISKDASGTFEAIVANGNVSGQFYVDVKDGQFLTLNDLTIANADEVKTAAPVSSDISEGMYLVGTDILAGRYKVAPEGDSGYWQTSKDASGTFEAIIANGNISGPGYIDVKDGQFLTLNGLTASLAQ